MKIKITISVILILSSIIWTGCSSEQKIEKLINPKFLHEWIEGNSYNFPKGIYYQFSGIPRSSKSGTEFVHYNFENHVLLLGYLLGKGIDIEEAWSQHSENSCGLLQVEVPPVILIRVSQKNNRQEIESNGFTYVEEPKLNSCSNQVNHYIF